MPFNGVNQGSQESTGLLINLKSKKIESDRCNSISSGETRRDVGSCAREAC